MEIVEVYKRSEIDELDVRLTARATVITWFKPPYHC